MTTDLHTLKTVDDLRRFVKTHRTSGKTIALVPTMGALHSGHMALVRHGLQKADICIASIFVNPTQFAPHEDLDAYPRTWDSDCALLKENGAQAVFYPSVEEIYPDDFATTVHVSGVTEPLEGERRPGHFDGVATIVAKLLLQALPDIALFGEKDYQQLQLIRHMVKDLNIPVTITGVPTVREADGLALSSRNRYLTDQERAIAPTLHQALKTISERIRAGQRDYTALEQEAEKTLLAAGFDSVDYIAIRNATTLKAPAESTAPDELRLLAAAWLGKARLIDNCGI